MPHTTRESWLLAVAEKLKPIIEQHAHGAKFPPVKVSCGWPARSGLRAKTPRIGECWQPTVEGCDVRHVFISPTQHDSVRVADTLAHELCHAILPKGTGHKGPFARLARSIGLEGKPTATFAGPDFEATLRAIVAEEGEYPHSRIEASNMPKQTTRMYKAECPSCGYTLRLTRRWIAHGLPTCPCGTPLEREDAELDREPLTMVEQTTEFLTEDRRFGVRRFVAKGRESRWMLVDFEPDDGGPARLAGQLPTEDDARERIAAIREGDWTPPPAADHEDHEDYDEWDDDDEEAEAEYLADDEDEDPDYPEDQEDHERGDDRYPEPAS